MPSRSSLQLILKLREALKHAETELQRRCFISEKIGEAIKSADDYLAHAADTQSPTKEE